MLTLTRRPQVSSQRTPARLGLKLNPNATVSLTSPPWIVEIEQRLHVLMSLPDNWDGEGGVASDCECAIAVLQFLLNRALHETPAPQLIPMWDGGVQVEWHLGNQDLQVTFMRDDSRAFYFVSSTGVESEGDASTEEDRVADLIAGLSFRKDHFRREH